MQPLVHRRYTASRLEEGCHAVKNGSPSDVLDGDTFSRSPQTLKDGRVAHSYRLLLKVPSLLNENVMLTLTLETKLILLHLPGLNHGAIASLSESLACCS